MVNQKMEPKPSREQFNESAAAIEDAQGEIRLIVKNAFLYRRPREETERKIRQSIEQAKKKISIVRLADDAERSLLNFANQQRRTWIDSGVLPEIFLLFGATTDKKQVERELVEKKTLADASIKPIKYATDAKGIPLGQYYRDVWKEKIQPTLQRLAKEVALDPNDYSGRNSLRNLAEMEVRYNGHQEDIASLREAGERLVVCSAHADCSDRCAPYQGRVYSLDGTRGITPDGRRYVPLEEATKNPRDLYVTKAGRVYQNGLLGFNCRHKLYPYRQNMGIPTVTAEDRKKEYEITKIQREMERRVRNYRVEALNRKDTDRKGYLTFRVKAAKAYEDYKQFSKQNQRAFYPMRVQI